MSNNSTSATTNILIPADITAKVHALTARLHSSALKHFARDDADIDGPFTSATSGIDLEWCKAARTGAHMRQAVDCKLADEFATWLASRSDNTSSESVIKQFMTEYQRGLVDVCKGMADYVSFIEKKANTVMWQRAGDPLTTHSHSLLAPSNSGDLMPDGGLGGDVEHFLTFLTEYKQSQPDVSNGMADFLSLIVEKATALINAPSPAKQTHRIVNPHGTYFDTLLAASNPGDLDPDDGLGWEAIRQVCMQSSRARKTFWSDACQGLRKEFLTDKGWCTGGWPDLAEDLRVAAKTRQGFSGKSIMPPATDEQTLRGWVEEVAQ